MNRIERHKHPFNKCQINHYDIKATKKSSYLRQIIIKILLK
jgi:hypothetical protein